MPGSKDPGLNKVVNNIVQPLEPHNNTVEDVSLTDAMVINAGASHSWATRKQK